MLDNILSKAIKTADITAVSQYLTKLTDLNELKSALDLAVDCGRTNKKKILLIKKNCEINNENPIDLDHFIAPHKAICNRLEVIIKLLLDKGLKIYAPLMIRHTIKEGYENITHYLFTKLTDINSEISAALLIDWVWRKVQGDKKDEAMLSCLLNQNIDINAPRSGGDTTALVQCAINYTHPDESNLYPNCLYRHHNIEKAAEAYERRIQLLLANGANPKKTDKHGFTAHFFFRNDYSGLLESWDQTLLDTTRKQYNCFQAEEHIIRAFLRMRHKLTEWNNGLKQYSPFLLRFPPEIRNQILDIFVSDMVVCGIPEADLEQIIQLFSRTLKEQNMSDSVTEKSTSAALEPLEIIYTTRHLFS